MQQDNQQEITQAILQKPSRTSGINIRKKLLKGSLYSKQRQAQQRSIDSDTALSSDEGSDCCSEPGTLLEEIKCVQKGSPKLGDINFNADRKSQGSPSECFRHKNRLRHPSGSLQNVYPSTSEVRWF